MSLHKVRPKLKEISKKILFLKKGKKGVQTTSTKNKIKMFSPDMRYLNSKRINKLEKYFHSQLDERRMLKYFFGFYRTALLQKVLKDNKTRSQLLNHSLIELELCSRLERRLDVLLYRLGFVPTLYAAKQLIAHKKVRVNNFANSSFSRLVKKGDIISFDLLTQLKLQKHLYKKFKTSNLLNLTNSNQIEINFKTLRIIVLTNKINLFSQIPNYSRAWQ